MKDRERALETDQKARPPIWTPLFISIVVLRLCFSITSHCTLAGTPIYMQRIGEASFYSGALILIFTIATIVARIFSGALVDILSRRSVTILGALCVLIGPALTVLAPSLPMNVISYVFIGVGFAFMHTAVSSATSDILPKSRLGEGIGYSSLGQSLGMAVGPVIAIWFTGFDHPEMFLVGLSATGLFALLLSLGMRYEKHPERLHETASYRIAWEKKLSGHLPAAEPAASSIGGQEASPAASGASQTPRKPANRFFEKAALRGGLPILFFAVGVSVFYSFTALFAQNTGYANPGVFFTIAAVATIAVRLLAAKAFDKDDVRRVFLVPVLFGIAALLGICFVRSELVFDIMGIGYGIAVGMTIPILNTVAVKVSPPERSGPANALFYLMYDIGVAIGAVIWSPISASFGYAPMFVGAALFFAVAYAVSLVTLPRKAKAL